MSIVKLMIATISAVIAWNACGTEVTSLDFFKAFCLMLTAFILRKEKDE